ncbi:RNA 2'-phosphotransferase [Nonomuraea sp. NPDC050227]|uniref:RNA 2'-phosphotransferase n=1 Tax=Nonomuraea sp. NPDC050227 TaxID=3364360 RepID=UPI00379F8D26
MDERRVIRISKYLARNLGAIRREGLRPMSRHHVHLSPDRETAVRVGARRGRPVVLAVAAGDMHAGGHLFLRSDNGVWLTAHVPPGHLRFPS